jgi:hypothetical protein
MPGMNRESYTVLIYYRVDGRLESKRIPLTATTVKERKAEARAIAQAHDARLVSIDSERELRDLHEHITVNVTTGDKNHAQE